MCVELGHAKFLPFSARGTVSNWRLNGWRGRKNVRFPMENWSISQER